MSSTVVFLASTPGSSADGAILYLAGTDYCIGKVLGFTLVRHPRTITLSREYSGSFKGFGHGGWRHWAFLGLGYLGL